MIEKSFPRLYIKRHVTTCKSTTPAGVLHWQFYQPSQLVGEKLGHTKDGINGDAALDSAIDRSKHVIIHSR